MFTFPYKDIRIREKKENITGVKICRKRFDLNSRCVEDLVAFNMVKSRIAGMESVD